MKRLFADCDEELIRDATEVLDRIFGDEHANHRAYAQVLVNYMTQRANSAYDAAVKGYR
jgi:hypothetical protein